MDIQSAILQGGGIDAIASQLGIPREQAQAGAGALLPAVLGGFKQNAQAQPQGLEGLAGMLGGMGGGGLFDNVVADGPTDIGTGNNLLGEIFGSKDVSRAVAGQASGQTGLDPSTLQQMLPMLAMLVGGFLSRGGGATAQQQQGGGLGGLLGGLLGGGQSPAAGGIGGLGSMLDMDGDGNPLDDILGMAGRLTGR